MPPPYSCTPNTSAERQNFAQCSSLDSILGLGLANSSRRILSTCQPTIIDAYPSTLDEELELDRPLVMALALKHASTNADEAALLLASAIPPEKLPKSDKMADATFDSLFGGGNLPGNLSASIEASLKAAWKRQAANAFKTLLDGTRSGAIRLGPHISISPHKIGKGGDLRKGARLKIRISRLPMTVIQSLPAPVVSKASGQFGAMRVSARDLVRIEQAASAIAETRFKSIGVLRSTATRLGGGVLAFGPSAAIDLYNSARVEGGSLSMDWRGFGLKSARSQSGNLVGFVAGAGAVAGATALGIVATVGWPVVLVGLGAGLVAQIAWGSAGGDDWAEAQAKRALDE